MADYQDLRRRSWAGTGPPTRRRAGGSRHGALRVGAGRAPTETQSRQGRCAERIPVVVTARGPVVTGLPDDPAADAAVDAQPGPAAYSLRTPSQVTRDLGFARAPAAAAVAHGRRRRRRPVTVGRAGQQRPGRRTRQAPCGTWSSGAVPRRHADNLVAAGRGAGTRGTRGTAGCADAATTCTDVSVSANDRASGGGLGRRSTRLPSAPSGFVSSSDDRDAADADATSPPSTWTRSNGQASLMRELVEAVDDAASAGGRRVRAELLAWDGHSDADSRGAAVFAAWRTRARRAGSPSTRGSRRCSSRRGHSRLFGGVARRRRPDRRRAGTSMVAGGPASASTSPRASALHSNALRRRSDSVDVWGDRHWLDPLHALDGLGGAPSVPPDPVSGDKGCVLAAASAPGVTDRCYGGPVARYVWDLADRGASRWVVPFGASGVTRRPALRRPARGLVGGPAGTSCGPGGRGRPRRGVGGSRPAVTGDQARASGQVIHSDGSTTGPEDWLAFFAHRRGRVRTCHRRPWSVVMTSCQPLPVSPCGSAAGR